LKNKAISVFCILFLGGCSWFSSKAEEPYLPNLEIDEKILEATEGSLEKSYDPLTLLKRSEAYYRDKSYIEASGEYQRFLDLHPLHRFAGYAHFKLGMSYFHQIRSIDQDQEPLQKALHAFQNLLAKYPDSPYTTLAKEKINFCRERLAAYQFYVGRFYYKKNSYPAAVSRFQGILKDFKDTPTITGALYYLGRSYQLSGIPEKATLTFQELITEYPKSPYHEKAVKYLKSLNTQEDLAEHYVETEFED
jgi:outer membrane protein assembly factor BamD